MSQLDSIVEITISRETRAVSRAGFGVPMIFGVHSEFADRIKSYTSITAVGEDFPTSAPEYVAANDIFSQQSPPNTIKIGRATAVSAYADDIAAIEAEDDDWYAILPLDRTKDGIEDIAAAIESRKKICIATTDSADVKNDVAGNIAEVLEAANYDRTALLFSEDTDNWANAAWAGRCLSRDPGSLTWKFKTLAGITVDTLTDTEIANIEGNDANVYITIGGIAITQQGKVASGEFIDIIRGIDWLESRIQEDIYELLVNAEKVPFTDPGVAIIENKLRQRLQDAINQGVLASFSVSVPKVANILNADKLARTLPDVQFDGVLAGAIHKVEIDGRVSV